MQAETKDILQSKMKADTRKAGIKNITEVKLSQEMCFQHLEEQRSPQRGLQSRNYRNKLLAKKYIWLKY